MAVQFVGTTNKPANVSTAQGPAYVDSSGKYWKVGSSSPAPVYTPPPASSGQMSSGLSSGSNGSVLEMINNLVSSTGSTEVKMPSIPKLDFNFPSGADINAKWKEFLDLASKAPDIVNYYQNLLDQAKGDTELAKGLIEKDYSMGVRQEKDTLTATLEELGLKDLFEAEELQNKLNERGIALTQEAGEQPVYAGGGRAGVEVGRLDETQRLRKEAEIRSSTQQIEKAGLTREKGLTQAGSGLQKYGLELQGDKQSDIMNRASQNFGIYQQGQQADLMKAQLKQQQEMSGGGGGGGGNSGGSFQKPPYLPNVVNQTVSYGGRTWKGNPGSDWTPE